MGGQITQISAQDNDMIATENKEYVVIVWGNAHIWYHDQQTVKSPTSMVCNLIQRLDIIHCWPH